MSSPWGKRLATVALTVGIIAAIGGGLRYVLAPRRFTQTGTGGASDLPANVAVRSERNTYIGYLNQTPDPAWTLRADVVDISADTMRVEARGNVEAELLDAPTGKRRALVRASENTRCINPTDQINTGRC